MKQEELRQTLTEFAADRLALLHRHEAAARTVSHYDFNNTYQYVIAREEQQITWLRNALGEVGSTLPPPSPALALPEAGKGAKSSEPSAFRGILEDDARQMAAFVARWRSRVDALTHDRHRIMLNVILGESLEHQRFFEQAAAGFEELLGRRTEGSPRIGGVLPTRWIE